jgi:hypothetical protein
MTRPALYGVKEFSSRLLQLPLAFEDVLCRACCFIMALAQF